LGLYLKSNKSIGVDISKNQIEYAKAKYPEKTFYTVEEFENLYLEDTFNTITVIGLLEFLSDEEILDLITYLKTLLKKEGNIIFSTPNFKGSMKLFSKLLKYLSPISYEDEWITKKGKKEFFQLFYENNIHNFSIEKHINFGIIFSFFNLNFGTKTSQIIAKIFKYKIGWILLIKLSK